MQFYSLVVAGVDPETHDVRRDFVREARTREYFFKHGHEVPGVRLFVRSPGAGRRDLLNVLARRSRMRGDIHFSHPIRVRGTWERRAGAKEHGEQALVIWAGIIQGRSRTVK